MEKLADFSLKDANGKPVKMTFIGIKTLEDGTKYMNVMAYSKDGGLTFDNLSEDDIAKLKEMSILGIMIKDTKHDWK